MKLKILIVILTLTIFSCDYYGYNEEDYFYVEYKGATMPLWVTGNISSRKFILYVAGGPGESGLLESYVQSNDEIKDNFGMVFYDQRGSGNAHGTSSRDQISVDQYSEDLSYIVDVINLKYNNPEIYLMSMSWGGFLTTHYLLDELRESKIKGWIGIGGAHNWKRLEELSRLWVMDYAREREDDLTWRIALNWYKDNPEIDESNIAQHAIYLQMANAYTPEDSDGFDFHSGEVGVSFFSRNNFFASQLKVLYLTLEMDHLDKNLVPGMGEITLPTLLIWGRKDFRVPLILGEEALEALGSEDKSLLILENSGHGVDGKDTNRFNSEVISFIDRN